MYDDIPILSCFLALALPALAIAVFIIKSGALRKALRSHPAVIVLVVLAAWFSQPSARSKGWISPRFRQLLTTTVDGQVKDLSGTVASGISASALDQLNAESAEITEAALTVTTNAEARCVALTNQLLNAEYDVAYISLDLPRGTPAETNHNIMITFEQVAQTSSNLTAWVWFSEMPATNVDVYVECSINGVSWPLLAPVTNSYPDTELIGAVDCIKYIYEIPSAISGTPLKPNYEISFGGYQADQYLSVSEDGVVVSTNGVDCLPFTGWDDFTSGTNSLLVRSIGGIAVEAIYNGVSIKGVN